MDYLSNDAIIDLVNIYLKENIYDYAIMIDGGWGSGKTYFVKNILGPELKKTGVLRDAIYISLYGVREKEEISNLIFTTIAENKAGTGKKIIPFASNGLKIVSEIVGGRIGSKKIEGINLKEVFSPFINYGKYYFIFDDLERCSMPINDAIGYINNFVEHNNSKVIVIANQEEICSAARQCNLEVKYLLASRDNIKYPPKEGDTLEKSLRKPEYDIDLEELKRRCEYLFKENTLYLQVREKLIGKTIFYQPDMSIVVPEIFNKCLIGEAREIVKPCEPLVIDILTKERHYNIRTLQFALIFFSKVSELFVERETDIWKQVLQDILLAIINVSISYKSGAPQHEWINDSEYGVINLNNRVFDSNSYFTSFRFIHDYIYSSNCDREHIIKTVEEYVRTRINEFRAPGDPTSKLRYYWEMDDEAIEKGIYEVYKNLEAGEYGGDSYRWIISILFTLKSLELEPIPIRNFFEIMKANVLHGTSIYTLQQPAINQDSFLFSEYEKCIEELQKLEDSIKGVENRKSINEIFEMTSGWGEAFYEYYESKKVAILSENKELFNVVDINKCNDRVMDSSVKDLSDFRRGLGSIYQYSNIEEYFAADGKNLLEFKQLLEKDKIEGKIKQLNIKLLIEQIEGILKRLDYNPLAEKAKK
ncbi:MAG: hypothetical protein EOM54_10885 [Clostridia bacterium]|nr:hypothetical protein [Clostridia bacterium]